MAKLGSTAAATKDNLHDFIWGIFLNFTYICRFDSTHFKMSYKKTEFDLGSYMTLNFKVKLLYFAIICW